MKHVAVVPVKETSERVQNKNFRPFLDSMSLLEWKLKQLKRCERYEKIYVSSDYETARDIAKTMAVEFLKRDTPFCDNKTPWNDVIYHVVDQLPCNQDAVISWCHVTSPTFSRFGEAIDDYESAFRDGYDSLVTVSRFNEFLVTPKGRPYNYSWGVWHDYSQNLEELYRVTGALFMAPKGLILRHRYVIGKNPRLYSVNQEEALDVDTEYDFRLAQWACSNQGEFKC